MRMPKLCAMAAAIASIHIAARAQDAPPTTPPAQSSADATPTTPAPAADAAVKLETVQITGKRLDAARSQLAPETGSTIYRFATKDIQALPMGDATPLNQVLLQAPGVVQDSYGQLHVRGDHSNLQYRFNGVMIPEAISGFGQALDTRFADQLNVLTGALPAQYGYRTAGVVDIHTKGSELENGGSVSVMGGSRGQGVGSLEYGGTSGPWNYFVTGSYLRNNIGIENPTPESNALHDATRQSNGFGYLSRVLDADSRVSLLMGTSYNKFEIPNVPGQTPSFTLDGAPPVDSANLDARQTERNSFQVLSYQSSPTEALDYQLSILHRYTDVRYQPDPIGDLVFNGVAANILRSNQAYGAQADMSFRLNDAHTLRSGLFLQQERANVDNSSSVFDADDDGNQLSGVPRTIVDNTQLSGNTYGVYLQDEWRATKALTVNYGARFDAVDTVTSEHQLSPRLGMVYDLTADTRVHAGYARYFTPPSTEKIDTSSVAKFLDTTNALPSDANTAVKSERSHYFDVGLAHQLTRDITLGIDAYYRKVKNLQDEGQFGNALIYSAFNYDQGRVRGIELSTTYKHQNLSAYANASLSKAEGKNIVTGQFNFDADELAYIADHWVHLDHDQTVSGSAGMSYQMRATRLSTDVLYGSGLRRGFANSEHLPAYAQVNLGAVHSFQLGGLGKVDGRIAVLNVFDRLYELRDGSGIGVGAPQYGQRRGVFVGITKYL